jgi:hypothetical protein
MAAAYAIAGQPSETGYTPDNYNSMDGSAPADSLNEAPMATTQPPAQKLTVVRHNFKYREQIGLALGMMAFIALIMTSTQSWNP